MSSRQIKQTFTLRQPLCYLGMPLCTSLIKPIIDASEVPLLHSEYYPSSQVSSRILMESELPFTLFAFRKIRLVMIPYSIQVWCG